MNILEAKNQVKNAVRAYMAKDKFGNYMIPQHKQRPVFLMGPPGIGKTAIMEQIASELGIGLLSYSMTHHTRQSALGLPMIKQFEYEGETFDISEYTMSEIIASIYQTMKSTGIKNGILFLDEINCVSETLTPIMLQFLQYKVFGKHKVPDGWIVVTAGNPPEYNDSVREFDVATWDRLKRVNVEPEFNVWKKYAESSGVHSAVISYLERKQQNFYKIETTPNGKTFVTARGWDDLSQMIQAYEHENITVDTELIFQYLQNEEIAQDFTMFYDEYSRYRKYYNINEILNGTITSDVSKRSQNAKTTEKIAVAHLLLNEVLIEICDAETEDSVITKLHKTIKEILSNNDKSKALDSFIAEQQGKRKAGMTAKNMNDKQLYELTLLITILENTKLSITNEVDSDSIIKNQFNNCIDNLETKVNNISKHIDNMLSFIETYFKDKSILTMAVRKMTENPDSVSFLSKYESTMYSKYCNLLQIDSKKSDIKEKIKHFTI